MFNTVSTRFHAFWFSIIALAVAVEIWALTRKDPGDTLSEWTWSKVSTVPLRMALGGLLVWLIWHFLFVGPKRGLGRWDLVAVCIGLGIGAAATKWGWR